MTRDEIRLIGFVLATLAIGACVQWWKHRHTPGLPEVAPIVAKAGWAEPPYVFKSRQAMDELRRSMPKEEASEPSSHPQSTP